MGDLGLLEKSAAGTGVGEYAEQTLVITLAGLRRLTFGDQKRSLAARTYLAALGRLVLRSEADADERPRRSG